MLDPRHLTQRVATHGSCIRVVTAEVKGSAPREVGAAMLVWLDGQEGTIGGGALEYEATQAARAMLNSDQRSKVTRHPLGPNLGQCCGGAVTLVSERIDVHFLSTLPNDLPFARRVEGSADQPLGMTRDLAMARGQGQRILARLEDGWWIDPVHQSQRALWIWGAGHVGRAIVDVLAPLPQFALTWIDTAKSRFPDVIPDAVEHIPAADPARLAGHAPKDAEHLILTYSHALDLALCDALLTRGFSSAGLIGSATKWTRFQKRLAAMGHQPDQILRITCPIGDPKLGKHPQAIAIGIAAKLLNEKAEHASRGTLTA